jgi:hypothetical protein
LLVATWRSSTTLELRERRSERRLEAETDLRARDDRPDVNGHNPASISRPWFGPAPGHGEPGLAGVVVYNDAAYATEVHHFAPEGAPMDTVRFLDTDFAALARVVGMEAVTVRSEADLAAVGDWLERGRPRPLLVDDKVVPTVVAEWLEEAFQGHSLGVPTITLSGHSVST